MSKYVIINKKIKGRAKKIMKTSKLVSVILIIAILTTSFLSVSSFGLDSESAHSGYKKLSKLSKAEIVQLTTDVNINNYMNFYVSKPSVTNPYSMGEVRADMQQNALNRMNAYRRLAGLAPVSINSNYTKLAQAASVVNATNDMMTHFPTKPADMPNGLYNDGYEGASHSNIACYMGYQSKTGPLTFSVDLWMEDSDEYNIDKLGHRRWVINPTMKATGFGCATATSTWVHTAMYAFDNSATSSDYDFISWPPSGYMPNDTAFFTPAHAWSISLNPSKYNINDLSQVEVEIEDSKDNEWEFEGDADDDGYFNIDLGGYGITRNAIIFRPDVTENFEGTYTVTVEGLKTTSGKATTLEFEVEFFSAEEFKNHPTTETTTQTTTETTTETTTATTTETTTETTTATTTETTTETTTTVTTTVPPEEDSSDFEVPTTEITQENSSYDEITDPTTETTTTPPVIQQMQGDLTGDGKITASDARAALRISAKIDTPTEEQFMAADVNGDKKITASDARIILRVAAKLQSF